MTTAYPTQLALDFNHSEWRPIPGRSTYEVTPDGRVRSWRTAGKVGRADAPRELSGNLDKYGYARARITDDDGHGRNWLVHHLVLLAYVGPCPDGCVGLHWDDDRTNNHVSNLRWATRAENSRDAVRNGRSTVGERNPGAKLTEHTVRRIIAALAAGEQQRDIARRFGVNANAISRIYTGDRWPHLHRPWLKVEAETRRGEAHGNAKPTEAQVREIIDALHAGEKQSSICRRFGALPNVVSRIRKGTRRAHLPRPWAA